MKQTTNIWPKQITVDKRIVKILSQSTYENLPIALKEIITNAYDADASIVKIDVDLDKEMLIIYDDGNGMSENEFGFLIKIAGRKREKGTTTKSGRKIIGQFGVGFMASFPFFNTYSIETTKGGLDEVVHATVPCYEYFNDQRYIDIGEIDIRGKTLIEPDKKSAHYTKITLKGFTNLAKAFFFNQDKEDKRKYSVHSFTGIEKLKWGLSEDLPISYSDERFNSLTKKYSPNLTFKVLLNEKELLRQTYGGTLLEANGTQLPFVRNTYVKEELIFDPEECIEMGKIKFQYFILSDKKSVRPYEARYIKRRNLNVGVGRRTRFGIGVSRGGARSRLHQLTGELHILEGLNDLINVSRDDFVYSEDYDRVIDFMVEKLTNHSNFLETEADYQRNLKSSQIKNLSFIQTVDKDETQNSPTFKRVEESTNSESSKADGEKGMPQLQNLVKLTTHRDESQIETFEKTIQIKGAEYSVRKSDWDFESEKFPACKLDGDVLIINRKYPLFKGVKHTDVFIKLHLLLLINHQNGTLEEDQYMTLTKEIIEFYKDYI